MPAFSRGGRVDVLPAVPYRHLHMHPSIFFILMVLVICDSGGRIQYYLHNLNAL